MQGFFFENTHANLIDLTLDGGSGVVKAWKDGTKLYIASPGETYFPVDSTGIFSNFSNVISFNFSNINTSLVEKMSGLFSGCSSIERFDLSNFDISSVTNMSYMFIGCSNLTSINLSNFDTSSVTNMTSIFSGCSSLVSINLDNWDLRYVSDILGIFASCTSLTTISCRNWKLPSAFSNWLFRYASGNNSPITTIDVTGWDLSNTTSLHGLFADGASLTNIVGIETWDLSNVSDVSDMLYGCTGLNNQTYYARTQNDADKLNNSTNKPSNLVFTVRG